MFTCRGIPHPGVEEEHKEQVATDTDVDLFDNGPEELDLAKRGDECQKDADSEERGPLRARRQSYK
jgi:hypothetical protein